VERQSQSAPSTFALQSIPKVMVLSYRMIFHEKKGRQMLEALADLFPFSQIDQSLSLVRGFGYGGKIIRNCPENMFPQFYLRLFQGKRGGRKFFVAVDRN
jgi:hypothetical protein